MGREIIDEWDCRTRDMSKEQKARAIEFLEKMNAPLANAIRVHEAKGCGCLTAVLALMLLLGGALWLML